MGELPRVVGGDSGMETGGAQVGGLNHVVDTVGDMVAGSVG